MTTDQGYMKLGSKAKSLVTCLALMACHLSSGWSEAETRLLFPNSDFEEGDFTNWTSKGDAFNFHPTKGDNPYFRNKIRVQHQGYYWVGTYEAYNGIKGRPGESQGDSPTGTLTSSSFTVREPFLVFRIGGGSNETKLNVSLIVDEQEFFLATGPSSDSMNLVCIDISAHMAKKAKIKIVDMESGHWGHLNVDDFRSSRVKIGHALNSGMKNFRSYLATNYDQLYRPQFHFTSRMNWLADPSGLLFDGSQYHLFFQHNPKGKHWGHVSWGHASSLDLIHWTQKEHAIVPFDGGMIFSGSAIVDHNNSLGVQVGETKTLVTFFTVANQPFHQSMSYSTDGGESFQLHKNGQPVIHHQGVSNEERGPKVFWHEESQRWVMLLWLKSGKPGKVRVFNSKNLVDWEKVSDIERDWFYGLVDLVELQVDQNPNERRWLIYDASFEYELGTFDGKTFKSDRRVRFGDRGKNFYGAQTFNNTGPSKQVMMGWIRGSDFQKKSMPFDQQLSFPTRLKLRSSPEGLRLCRWPIEEITRLYQESYHFEEISLRDVSKKISLLRGELLDVSLCFSPENVILELRGIKFIYDKHDEVFISKIGNIPAPAIAGKVSIRVLVDRGSMECFVNGGDEVATSYILLDPNDLDINLSGKSTLIHQCDVHILKSSWSP